MRIRGVECGECNQNSAILRFHYLQRLWRNCTKTEAFGLPLMINERLSVVLQKLSTLPKADFTDLSLNIIRKRKIFLMLCHQKVKYLFVLKIMSSFRDNFYLWINIFKQYLNQSKIKPWTSIYKCHIYAFMKKRFRCQEIFGCIFCKSFCMFLFWA